MPTLKEVAIEILNNLPDSVSLEEIMYKINLAAEVMEGISDADQGSMITTEELLRLLDSWRQI